VTQRWARIGQVESVSAVVFDIGGVLLDWDPRHLYRQLFDGDETAMERFLAQVCSPEWHAAQDLGYNVGLACRELASRHPDQAEMILAWADGTEKMVAGPITGTVEIMAELKCRGVACYALSNMEAETFPLRLERYDFLRALDGQVISGLEKVAKPDPRIYRVLLERYELSPGRTLFIDDKAVNVTAARAAGMQALQFTSAPALRAELVRMGLLET
jgi:2-haloacid dehalogenase